MPQVLQGHKVLTYKQACWFADFAYERTEHTPAVVQAGSSVKAPASEKKVFADMQTFQELEAFAERLARVVCYALLCLFLRVLLHLKHAGYTRFCCAQHDREHGGLEEPVERSAAPWERTPDVCTVPCGVHCSSLSLFCYNQCCPGALTVFCCLSRRAPDRAVPSSQKQCGAG